MACNDQSKETGVAFVVDGGLWNNSRVPPAIAKRDVQVSFDFQMRPAY